MFVHFARKFDLVILVMSCSVSSWWSGNLQTLPRILDHNHRPDAPSLFQSPPQNPLIPRPKVNLVRIRHLPTSSSTPVNLAIGEQRASTHPEPSRRSKGACRDAHFHVQVRRVPLHGGFDQSRGGALTATSVGRTPPMMLGGFD